MISWRACCRARWITLLSLFASFPQLLWVDGVPWSYWPPLGPCCLDHEGAHVVRDEFMNAETSYDIPLLHRPVTFGRNSYSVFIAVSLWHHQSFIHMHQGDHRRRVHALPLALLRDHYIEFKRGYTTNCSGNDDIKALCQHILSESSRKLMPLVEDHQEKTP